MASLGKSKLTKGVPLRVLCWQGYETTEFTGAFTDRFKIDVRGQTLLSDASTANRLLGGDYLDWDILNINNAYVRECLFEAGLIQVLDKTRFSDYQESIHPLYAELLPWSYSEDGDLIGIGQRFGPFNMVVNTKSVAKSIAEDQGFELANDPAYHQRFGILNYPDFNVFHFCIGAGLNPFENFSEEGIEKFQSIANRWYGSARMVEDDHHILNKALIAGEIDFYISGGIYTASPARLAGHQSVVAITPKHGPIEGRGGIVFTEVTSILNHSKVSRHAEGFLEYMLEPETAARIAFIDGTCNPVAQMGNPKVFNSFSKSQLNAIQWDTLEKDLKCCRHYQIPPNNARLLAILISARKKFGYLN